MSRADILIPAGRHLISVRGVVRWVVILVIVFRAVRSLLAWELQFGPAIHDLLWVAFGVGCVIAVAGAFDLVLYWFAAVVRGCRAANGSFNWVSASLRTLVVGVFLGGFSWLAVVLLTLAHGAVQGWSDALRAWVLPLPRFPASVAVPVRDALGTLFVAVVLAFAGYFALSFARDVLRSWRRSIRLLGSRRALRSAGQMTRLLYRQPIRPLLRTAPGVVAALFVVVGWGAVSGGETRSVLEIALFGGLFLFAGILVPILAMTPPVLAWLSVSDYDQFRVLKNLQKIVPGGVKTLIDQTSPGIVAKYYEYYGRQNARIRAFQRGTLAGAVRRIFPAEAFLNPKGGRFESLRTRPGHWEQSVRDLIDMAAIVVVDARVESAPVKQEIAWMCDPGRAYKAIYLVDDDFRSPVLEAAIGADRRSDILLCNEKLLYDVVARMTESAATLPIPNDDRWRRRVNEQIDELDKLIALVREASVPDRELDRAVREWAQGHPTEGAGEEGAPPYSTSLDAAIALINQRLPGSSLALFVYANGRAAFELGVEDAGGDWMVYSSGREPVPPPRAALLALFDAERGSRKPGDDTTEGAEAGVNSRWRERARAEFKPPSN